MATSGPTSHRRSKLYSRSSRRGMQRFVGDGLGVRLLRYRAVLRCAPPLMGVGTLRATWYDFGLCSLSPFEGKAAYRARRATVAPQYCSAPMSSSGAALIHPPRRGRAGWGCASAEPSGLASPPIPTFPHQGRRSTMPPRPIECRHYWRRLALGRPGPLAEERYSYNVRRKAARAAK
jgi:hypothetical protein